MEYRGIRIDLHREHAQVKASAGSSLPGRAKEILTSETSAKLYIFGIESLDTSVIFEFRSILDEFIMKKLSLYSSNGDILNTNQDTLGDNYLLSVYRKDATLVIDVENFYTNENHIEEFNMIHAKTLYAIISKVIHSITI